MAWNLGTYIFNKLYGCLGITDFWCICRVKLPRANEMDIGLDARDSRLFSYFNIYELWGLFQVMTCSAGFYTISSSFVYSFALSPTAVIPLPFGIHDNCF